MATSTNNGNGSTKVHKKKKKKSKKGSNNGLFIIVMAAITIIIVGMVVAIAILNNKEGNGNEETTSAGSTTIATDNFEQSTTTPVVKNDYPFVITGPSIYVRRDGSILSAEVEEFSKDYYSVDEFNQNYLEPEVMKYNNSKYGVNAAYSKDANGNLGAAINSLTMSGESLVLQMDFASPDDYIAFNQGINTYYKNWNTFKVGRISDMDLVDMNLVDKDGVSKSISEIKAADPTLYVCVVGYGGNVPTGFSGRFVFEGAVVYTTEGAGITGDNSAKLYDSEGLQYIIFE